MIKTRSMLALTATVLALSACAPYEPPMTNGPPPPYPAPASGPYGPYETRGSVAAPQPQYAVNTGVVTSIDVLRAERSGVSPGSAILGAVVGGVLGNQIGAGGGRAAATVVGAAGGALAGNAIGNRVTEAPDLYRIGIQYDGGGSQYIDVSHPGDLRPGDRVRVDGTQISRY